MIIAGRYSFNGGYEAVQSRYPDLLEEIELVIANLDSSSHRTKRSTEKTMPGRMLYSPRALNKAFKERFGAFEWVSNKVLCDYPTIYYTEGYTPKKTTIGAYRDMDFVKRKLGIEVQFGKYAFMVYNVCAKMTIFRNRGIIDTGVEIVPIKQFADEMSTGVSYFEQFVWDLEERGIADIDVPVLIIGIDSDPSPGEQALTEVRVEPI